MDLTGKVAVITGSSRGLGFSIAEALYIRGCHVVLCSRYLKDLKQAKYLLEQHQKSGKVITYALDITDETSVLELFSEAMSLCHSVDICVNNVGFLELCPIAQYDLTLWNQFININLTGAFLCSREMFRSIDENKRLKSILNVSSLSGIQGVEKFAHMSGYIASKNGVVGLTEGLSIEGKECNIAVNCVAPGTMNTKMFQKNFPEYQSATDPKDLLPYILPLCDVSKAKLPTGQVIQIDCNGPLFEGPKMEGC